MKVWKDIPNYVGYEISSDCEIRSKERYVKHKTFGLKKVPSHILKQSLAVHGYYRVSLWKNNRKKDLYVHLLFAQAFIPNHHNHKYINHKDGIKTNNCIDNLEWCTSSHNIDHAYETGLHTRNNRVAITNLETNEVTFHRSEIKASFAIGHKQSYISNCIYKGKYSNNKYSWIILED